MKKKRKPEPDINVRVINRRGKEIATAIQTDILPIKVKNGRPVVIHTEHFDCFIADPNRLTNGQIQRLATHLADKYSHVEGWDKPLEMERIIRQRGFTVPVEDCQSLTDGQVMPTSSFLTNSEPRDNQHDNS